MNRLLITVTLILFGLQLGAFSFNTAELPDKSNPYAQIEEHKGLVSKNKSIAFASHRFAAPSVNAEIMAYSPSVLKMDWNTYNLSTVVLDAGHGGKDTGTQAPGGTFEKDIALSITKRLAAYIRSNYPLVKVVLTREDDKFVPLHKRAKIANDNDAELFISIHLNSFKSGSVSGTETYVLGIDGTEENQEVVKRENDAVLYENDYESRYEEYGLSKNDPLSGILANSFTNAHLDQSLDLAQKIESKFKGSGRKSRGIHQAGFVVLKRTAMPSVLIEAGFLSNGSERKMLSTEAGKDKVALDIFSAFSEWKSQQTRQPKEKPTSNPDKSGKTDSGFVTTEGNVNFGLLLESTTKKVDLNQGKWKQVASRIVIEAYPDGNRDYVLKGYQGSRQKADAELKWLQKHGFPDAVVIRYENGIRKDKKP